MRTRRGICYPKANATTITLCLQKQVIKKKERDFEDGDDNNQKNQSSSENFSSFDKINCHYNCNTSSIADKVELRNRKRAKISPEFCSNGGSDFFDSLPDDLVVCILCKLSSSASCPADFINVLITCKRLNELGVNSMVLSKASPETFAIKAKKWSESAHRFLKQCSDAGNVDACYTLGMIRFYCLQNRGSGASLMAKAAINSHAPSLYSLAVIQFNGSGGTKTDKDLRAGVALCARAAFLGHVDALRELGHCLQDGYGVRQNVTEGRRFLVQANARELATALTCHPSTPFFWQRHVSFGCPLLSDFGCNVPSPTVHPANRFLMEWFAGENRRLGLRVCSHVGCSRPETRKHEFRRCSVCGAVNYCSRACQALDWKLRHKAECAPMLRWVQHDGDINIVNGNGNGDGDGGVNGMVVGVES